MSQIASAGRVALLSLAALALPLGTAAQTALMPGSPDLVAVPPQSYEHEIRIVAGVSRVIGHMTYTETLDGDRLVMVSHMEVSGGDMNPRDTTVVAWPGLQPILRAADDGEERSRVTFADGRIRGRQAVGNLDEALDAPLPEGAFAEGMASRLARSVPFTDGYTATFRFADKYGTVTTDTLRVSGPEAYTRADGTEASVWRVVVGFQPAVTYVVDDATREVLASSMMASANRRIEFAPPAPRPDGPVLRPGDAALNTGWMTDRTTTYTLRVRRPLGSDVGTATVTYHLADGVVTSETTLNVPAQGLEQTVTARADAATLAPLSQTRTGGPMAAALTFTDAAVSGTKTPADGAAEPVSTPLEAPVFDGAWMAEVVQSLPLAEGYATQIETYDVLQGVSSATIRVIGQEDVDGTTGWVVEAVMPTDSVTYVVDPATHALLKMRMSLQSGVWVEMTRP